MSRTRLLIYVVLIAVAGLWMAVPVSAEMDATNHAKVLKVEGQAMFMKSGSGQWAPLTEGAVLSEGDAVKTGKGSEVRLGLEGTHKYSEVRVREETQMTFDSFRHDADTVSDRTMLDVEIGTVLIKAEKLAGEDSRFEVKTPTSIVGIRGTVFEVNVYSPA